MPTASRDTLFFPDAQDRQFLETNLPPTPKEAPSQAQAQAQADSHHPSNTPTKPFLTLTFATSLDSMLALQPGTPTPLSGPASKAMTHYLRSRHDAILVGVGTAVADDPSLNCRLDGVGGYGGIALERQPRPVVLDPWLRWDFSESSKLFSLVAEGRGRAPFILTVRDVMGVAAEKRSFLERVGGKFLSVALNDSSKHSATSRSRSTSSVDWESVLKVLAAQGIQSVMVEGGAKVINSLLAPEYSTLIDSVIVTIAPTWLGQGGVAVSPQVRHDETGKIVPAARLREPRWRQFGDDVVLCGKTA